MASREDVGSWLDGGPTPEGGPGRGARLGLPATGQGSLAPLGRRVAALAVDWLACSLIAYAFFDYRALAITAVFAVENVLLVGTLGHTVGHRLLGLTVQRQGGGPPWPARAAVRTALLCLVIPAVVWDADGRGLHDRLAGTVIVRR